MAETSAGALQIVQTQQNLVGNTIAGGASAVSEQSSDSQVGILEQIRTITLQSFRKTSEIASTLANTLLLQKDESRKREDQSSELELEQKSETSGGVSGVTQNETISSDEPKKNISGFLGFLKSLGSILMPSFLLKLLGPLSAVFGKGGFLFKFLGRAGPLAAIGAAIFLITRYSDDIVKALTPIIEKIKKLFEENAPLFEALKNGFDFLFKNIIGGIGRVIGGIIDDISPLLQGISELFKGNFKNAFFLIGEGLLNVILFVPRAIARFFEPVLIKVENYIKSIPETLMNGIKSIGTSIANFFTVTIPNAIKNFINGIIDSLPLPDFVKNKLKIGTSQSKTPFNKEKKSQESEMMSPDDLLNQDIASYNKNEAESKNKTGTMSDQLKSKSNASERFVKDFNENKKEINEFQSVTGNRLDAKATLFNYEKGAGEMIFENPVSKVSTFISPRDFKTRLADLITLNSTTPYTPNIKPKVDAYGQVIAPDTSTDTPMGKILTPKRKSNIPLLDRDTGDGGTSVVNAPVNSSSVVNNSQPTISFTKMDTGVDPYTEKMQNSA